MQKEVETEVFEQFKLPIDYLDREHLHELSSVVADDLELKETKDPRARSIYQLILKPKTEFATSMIKKWGEKYTSNTDYLKESIQVVKNHETYKQRKILNYRLEPKNLLAIWKDLKKDNDFLERYNYMEWEYLKYLNYSSSFLECLSLIQIFSPIMSILVPIIMILIPFIILKMSKIPITLSMYFDVLKSIAKSHFIVKSLVSLKDFSMYNLSYFLITIAFYFFQVYQNTLSLIRLYTNISKINRDMVELKDYVFYSLRSIDNYLSLNENLETHRGFHETLRSHHDVLSNCYQEFNRITTKSFGISSIGNMGGLLELYYIMHTNEEYNKSILFSFGFQGYIDNIEGIYENMKDGYINETTFDKTRSDTKITDQYYPPLINENPVKNSCKVNKMIITGVNASGKTTMLKTTTINIIFSQQFGYGFFKEFSLNPYTHIHSYLNIPDTSGRDSLFQAESRRCKEIIDIIGENSGSLTESRHFCIFDELYSGTNPIEATKTAYAFLKYLSKYKNVHFILTTHYKEICEKIEKTKTNIKNYQMIAKELEHDEIEYTYQLKTGICKIQGAIVVLKDMKYPLEIMDTIRNYGRNTKKGKKYNPIL